MDYAQHLQPPTQTEPAPGTVRNSAGGYSFPVSAKQRLMRFLILGTEQGSYYASERELTIENLGEIRGMIQNDPYAVIDTVEAVLQNARAPKTGPGFLVLAMCREYDDPAVRTRVQKAATRCMRIPTHLFEYLHYNKLLSGWGRSVRRTIQQFYENTPVDRLAYLVTKYQSRHGFTHADALRVGHVRPPEPGTARRELTDWIGDPATEVHAPELEIVRAMEVAKTDPLKAIKMGATWEHLPSEALTDAAVWNELVLSGNLPLTAAVRNLGVMTNRGSISPMSQVENIIAKRLADPQQVTSSRLHPLQVLAASMTYASGHGAKGRLTWTPSRMITGALDKTFGLSFGNIQPLNQRVYVGVDVSGSMGAAIGGVPGLTARAASAALALCLIRHEPQYALFGFQGSSGPGRTKMVELKFDASSSLQEAIRVTDNLPFGATDCALPMVHALEMKIPVDLFVVLTDCETFAGRIHPDRALADYRKRMNSNARLVVVGMTSNGFTIANPNDPGMLDVVGFDTAMYDTIRSFAHGFEL